MKTMLDVIRDTKEAAMSARDGRWEVKMPDGTVYAGELGFKVFNPDWTCRYMKYQVGQHYEHGSKPRLCNNGYHYCLKAADCFNYYSFDPNNKVALVLAYGEIAKRDDVEDDKHCTDKLLVIREIPWGELLEIANEGKGNTGLRNTGDSNTGDSNTGHRNTGDSNTGDSNTGHRNTGDSNTGDSNFGNRCTGDFNLADDSTGVFCTENQKIRIFDKEADITLAEWRKTEAYELLRQVPPASEWRSYSVTSPKEDAEHPEIRENGGYFRVDTEGQRFIKWWDDLCRGEKEAIRAMPNFDADKFKKITGIDVNDENGHTRCYRISWVKKPCYEVGEKVIIKNLDSNHDEGIVFGVNSRMEQYSGQTATITDVEKGRDMDHYCYFIDLDRKNEWSWSASMFSGAVVTE